MYMETAQRPLRVDNTVMNVMSGLSVYLNISEEPHVGHMHEVSEICWRIGLQTDQTRSSIFSARNGEYKGLLAIETQWYWFGTMHIYIYIYAYRSVNF